eukprot:CAMPEP_0181245052 /NCGR_PEP_ID=MMETSP1096-20121128/43203_1 /TAXON_ID=156174 ORGANISM="Chrysochromulina ericina, Strain CCMP281" /NCGR_SAMPLE_ID=MMETSP1096 /ASSEMBLY_ACC=CAM_ASM_000453 /LENGTH=213 /DNA_ID=CAMNT_0023341673 /DNA_START=68 /DNA_END=706 /DNA_ORIENTATION=+
MVDARGAILQASKRDRRRSVQRAEPYQATWGVGRPGTDWGLAASRIGNHVQSRCARWLIVAQGVGNNQGQCKESASQSTCWWGENLVSQIAHPIMLRDQSKLVLSPHVYGHGGHDYMSDPNFPENMPAIWDTHWGSIQEQAGVPLLIGEWGGVWTDTTFQNRHIMETQTWQQRLQDYLQAKQIGFFYWALNDNSFRTGSLFHPKNEEKWHMLA